jgi:hypothetical protein
MVAEYDAFEDRRPKESSPGGTAKNGWNVAIEGGLVEVLPGEVTVEGSCISGVAFARGGVISFSGSSRTTLTLIGLGI